MATNSKTISSWVQKTPGVCGGRACIRNTRITVWGLVNSRRLGLSDEQILVNIVGLTPEDLHAAIGQLSDLANQFIRIIRPNPSAKP